MPAVPEFSPDGGHLSSYPGRSFPDNAAGHSHPVTRPDCPTGVTMYRGHSIGVVIPVYNEEEFVGDVIDGLPAYVDRTYVVDDRSTDDTWAEIQRRADEEVAVRAPTADGGGTEDSWLVPIRHETNQGRGGAVKTGYEAALADDVDVVAVLDGDGQMDPGMLDRVVDPVVAGVADYAKGDRLRRPADREQMSNWRLFGNLLLTALTRFSSGYWGMTDSQNGFTAISREMLADLDLDGLYDGYGFLNDVLVQLNERGARIADVPMAARYGEEESGIRYRTFVPFLSALLLHRFVRRLWTTYGAFGPRPVGLLYGLAALVGIGGTVRVVLAVLSGTGPLPAASAIPLSLVLVALAMAMDRRRNRSLVAVFGVDRSLGNR